MSQWFLAQYFSFFDEHPLQWFTFDRWHFHENSQTIAITIINELVLNTTLLFCKHPHKFHSSFEMKHLVFFFFCFGCAVNDNHFYSSCDWIGTYTASIFNIDYVELTACHSFSRKYFQSTGSMHKITRTFGEWVCSQASISIWYLAWKAD